MQTTLYGTDVVLRPATPDDIPALAAIRAEPQVYAWWRGGNDLTAAVADDLASSDAFAYAIEYGARIIGAIQWSQESDPDYRHANIDIYLTSALHGRGLGTDAVRTLARHLLTERGHHRITIDPAADNGAAIRSYRKVGFQPVGIMRRYERGPDGTWHDSLLMDLLADDLTD
ncbi:GNAT family N-acetyltransferase [Streptomyces sp. NPDC053560]|uniref:GNAT family N-acetyltransferase n=1 Tax=Streptomyces sp. NPDC053560 TaxID=3365711 RepID=UPI0037D36E62